MEGLRHNKMPLQIDILSGLNFSHSHGYFPEQRVLRLRTLPTEVRKVAYLYSKNLNTEDWTIFKVISTGLVTLIFLSNVFKLTIRNRKMFFSSAKHQALIHSTHLNIPTIHTYYMYLLYVHQVLCQSLVSQVKGMFSLPSRSLRQDGLGEEHATRGNKQATR